MFSNKYVQIALSVGVAFKLVFRVQLGINTIRMLIARDLDEGNDKLPSATRFVDQYGMSENCDPIEFEQYCDLLEYFLAAIAIEGPLEAPSSKKIDGTFRPSFSFDSYKKKKRGNTSGESPRVS